ncbi:hypothetical protein [Halalkalicoccus salilacus]|uniref:hypothetical protein n=1 Tax=Halalkalicoccus sp. GCM10025704 TaxID=3252662 RepID=UPI0036179E7A
MTPVGHYVAREFTDLLKRFEPVPKLNDVGEWFPKEGFDFDLGRLAGAEIVRSTKSDALAPTTHITCRLRSADRVQVLSYSHLSDVMEVCWRGTVEGASNSKAWLIEECSIGSEPMPEWSITPRR